MRPVELTIEGFGSYGPRTTILFNGKNAKGNPSSDDAEMSPRLFLVSGATGSGKTTIFDAITFALYGEVSAGTKKPKAGRDLCSHFGGTDNVVELTFTKGVGNALQQYRVVRRPARLGPRGGTRSEEAALYLPDGTVIDKPKSVNAKIAEIVGLDNQQFKQIGMLAQGEFMRLLRTEPKERKEIFRTLFNTQKYEEIQNAVSERVKNLKSELQTWWISVRQRCSDLSVQDGFPQSADLQSLRAEIDANNEPNIELLRKFISLLEELTAAEADAAVKAAEEHAVCAENSNAAVTSLNAARVLAGDIAEEVSVRIELKELEKQGIEIEKLRRLIPALRAAYELQAAKSALNKEEAELDEAKAAIEEQRRKLPDLQKAAYDTKEAEQEARDNLEAEQKRHSNVVHHVDAAIEKLCKIDEMTERLRLAENEKAKAEKQRAAAAQEREALSSRTEKDTQELEALKDTKVRLAECSSHYAELISARDVCDECIAAEQKADKARATADKAQRAYGDMSTKYTACELAFYSGYAGLLADTLKENEPCPVCGSVHHPAPAVFDSGATPKREDVDTLRAKTDDLRSKMKEASDKASEANATARTMLRDLRSRTATLLPNANDSATPGALHGQLADAINKAKTEEAQLKKNALRAEEIEADLDAAAKKKAELVEAENTAGITIAKCGESIQNLRDQIAAESSSAEYKSTEEAHEARMKSQTLLNDAKKAHETADALRTAEENRLSACDAKLNTLKEQYPAHEQSVNEAAAAYASMLAEKKMSEDEWIRLTGKHRKDQIGEYENRCTKYEAQRNRLIGRADSLAARINGRPAPDLEALESNADTARTALEQAKKTLDEIQSKKEEHEKVIERLHIAQQSRGKLHDAYAAASGLSDRLNGKLSRNHLQLETYVQRAYFESILNAANVRLLKMTGGQFELQLLDLADVGQGASDDGLNLRVYSRETGVTRRIETLSGGESFMTALALALGMSDTIEQESSAVSLEMMFIDEGFGSLDDEARKAAVNTLQKITESNKLIGIISHVKELADAIEHILEVRRDENGSHVHWVR